MVGDDRVVSDDGVVVCKRFSMNCADHVKLQLNVLLLAH